MKLGILQECDTFSVMNRAQQVFLHAIVWLAILLFFLFLGTREGEYYHSVVIIIYYGLLNIAIFYVNYLVILPKFLNARKFGLLALSIVALIAASALLKFGIATLHRDIILIRGEQRQYHISAGAYLVQSLFTTTFFIFLSTAFKFSVDWFLNEKVKKSLENDKLSAELAFLKSQINPHFLFNSLNNIYSLAYQKSEQTPEAILKLSEIMRYMLNESNETLVELGKEIRYLDNFIELQKLRFGSRIALDLRVEVRDTEKKIAPLILISFVENAFKHGVVTDPHNAIRIHLLEENGKLDFSVWNRKGLQNKDETGGVGLNNVKRRLELAYPGRHILRIENSDEVYYCRLSLDL
jgi:two-component system, LytTR family, sensor kinase